MRSPTRLLPGHTPEPLDDVEWDQILSCKPAQADAAPARILFRERVSAARADDGRARPVCAWSARPGLFSQTRTGGGTEPRGPALPLPVAVDRLVHVRVAVCHQVERRARRRSIVANTMASMSAMSPKVVRKATAKQATAKPGLLSGRRLGEASQPAAWRTNASGPVRSAKCVGTLRNL